MVAVSLRADTRATFGAFDATPALDDVSARLAAIDGTRSHAFSFDPELTVRLRAHFQGIVRLPLLGREPWFVVTKHHHEDKRLAGFLFVRFPRSMSRGEAFFRDHQPGGPGLGELAHFWGRGRSEHPGGLQSCGLFLACAQDPNQPVPAFISLVNAQRPENPSFLPALTLDGSHGETPMTGLSCSALTRLSDGHYLLAGYRYSQSNPGTFRLLLFRSNAPFLNANVGWAQVSELWRGHGFPASFQERIENIALLNQEDGALFLATLRGRATDNHVDLFRLSEDGSSLSFVRSKPFRTLPGRATLRAGGSLYVTPSGELVLYAVQKAGGGRWRDMMIEEFSV